MEPMVLGISTKFCMPTNIKMLIMHIVSEK